MKKILFSVVTLLSLVPSAALRAEEHVALPAMDPRVLKLFTESKEQIQVKQVELLQKNREQLARIQELEKTINEESYRKGRNDGLLIAGSIGAVAVVLTFFIAGRTTGGSSYSRR